MTSATLVLEDGTVFRGRALGATGETCGELVFCTGMTGYQEVLTDPSYCGQLVTMTAPHIGNTGLNRDDVESAMPHLAGFIVRAPSPVVSNWRAELDLHDYLTGHGIVGMAGCPTRALVRHIRSQGAMRAILSSVGDDVERLLVQARAAPKMSGADLASRVSCSTPYAWNEPAAGEWYPRGSFAQYRREKMRVVAYDFGIKYNILRLMARHGFDVTVVPAGTPADNVLAMKPDGVFLSNGPGDPAAVTYAIEAVRDLLGAAPIFGVCLGHQILALALGGRTYKLKFGHRGVNQPVKNLLTGRVEITTHNHGFAVEGDSLPAGVQITHTNLNDGCVEGLRQVEKSAFSVQFHPEAGPGPHDAIDLFEQFHQVISSYQSAAGSITE